MIIKRFGTIFSFDTDNIKYYDFSQLGTINNRILRCKCALTIEYKDGMPQSIDIKTDYVFGKTLAQLEQNAIQKISLLWNRRKDNDDKRANRRTIADTMYL